MSKEYKDMTLEELLELEKRRKPLTREEEVEQIVSFTFAELRQSGDKETTKADVKKTVKDLRGYA